MSTPDQEARALASAQQLLYDLSSGAEKRIPTATRQRARDVLRHYPLAADVRWLDDEQIGKRNPHWEADMPTVIRIPAEMYERLTTADDPDDMCDNCVTPWKCNGPHIGSDDE